MFKLQKMPANR